MLFEDIFLRVNRSLVIYIKISDTYIFEKSSKYNDKY